MDFYEQQPQQRVDELAARISRIVTENREWRKAAALASLVSLPPDFTPAQWLTAQTNALSDLMEKAKCS